MFLYSNLVSLPGTCNHYSISNWIGGTCRSNGKSEIAQLKNQKLRYRIPNVYKTFSSSDAANPTIAEQYFLLSGVSNLPFSLHVHVRPVQSCFLYLP